MAAVQTSTESSVLFNLRQLMQLESQRVEAEAAAARARAATELRALAADERARVEAARRAALEATRLEREREAALLRAQLAAAADERVQRQSLELQHSRELRAIEAHAKRSRAAIVAASVALAWIGAVAAHSWLSAPRIVRAQARAATAARANAAADPTGELARLREQVAKLTASREAPPQTTAVQLPVVSKRRVTPKLSHTPNPSQRRASPDDHDLDSLDTDNRDPIQGLN